MGRGHRDSARLDQCPCLPKGRKVGRSFRSFGRQGNRIQSRGWDLGKFGKPTRRDKKWGPPQTLGEGWLASGTLVLLGEGKCRLDLKSTRMAIAPVEFILT